VIWRLLALVVIAWAAGFVLFMVSLGKPLDPAVKTDAIVVLTGGKGRVDRGLELIKAQGAKRMLISGADPDVRPIDLALRYHADPKLFTCCIDLGYEAVDTRSNADETASWVRHHGFHSVRLVTSDWHMPRAKLELRNALDSGVRIMGDGVPTDPHLKTVIREYHKYLLRRVVLIFGGGR
jgi:uncharacterized SAM-binding protein YcdF (DUF218 family)